jgi:anamorsin
MTATDQPVLAAVPAKGSALAIGSPHTAQEGKYQTLITELEATRNVDRQMVDRVVDGGACLSECMWYDMTLN